MRPDPHETMAGVRRALAEHVGPEVGSVFGRTQLGYATALLQFAEREAESGVAMLGEENRELVRLLRSAGRRLNGVTSIDNGLVADLQAMRPASRRPDLRLSALRAENARLLGLLVRVQAACEERAGERVPNAIHRAIVQFLRRRNDRELGGRPTGPYSASGAR